MIEPATAATAIKRPALAATPEPAEPVAGVELVSVAAAEVLPVEDPTGLDGADVVTLALADGVTAGAVPGITGMLAVPFVKAEAGTPGATGTELAIDAASVVLGTLRGVTGTATDSVIAVEPDWTTAGLMAVARGLLGVQYSGNDVTVTVTVPSRAWRRSIDSRQHDPKGKKGQDSKL